MIISGQPHPASRRRKKNTRRVKMSRLAYRHLATPFTFDYAQKLLGKRTARQLPGTATTLRRVDPYTLAVRYHGTDVVILHRDGAYTLNHGGWHTATTREKMTTYGPPGNYYHPRGGRLFRNGRPIGEGHRVAPALGESLIGDLGHLANHPHSTVRSMSRSILADQNWDNLPILADAVDEFAEPEYHRHLRPMRSGKVNKYNVASIRPDTFSPAPAGRTESPPTHQTLSRRGIRKRYAARLPPQFVGMRTRRLVPAKPFGEDAARNPTYSLVEYVPQVVSGGNVLWVGRVVMKGLTPHDVKIRDLGEVKIGSLDGREVPGPGEWHPAEYPDLKRDRPVLGIHRDDEEGEEVPNEQPAPTAPPSRKQTSDRPKLNIFRGRHHGTKVRKSLLRSPAGGMIDHGLYYPGGAFVSASRLENYQGSVKRYRRADGSYDVSGALRRVNKRETKGRKKMAAGESVEQDVPFGHVRDSSGNLMRTASVKDVMAHRRAQGASPTQSAPITPQSKPKPATPPSRTGTGELRDRMRRRLDARRKLKDRPAGNVFPETQPRRRHWPTSITCTVWPTILRKRAGTTR
jgi:hypothetical protein